MELHDMIGDGDNLPEWMQSKVAQMSQMISDVKHALEYDQEEGDYEEHQEEYSGLDMQDFPQEEVQEEEY
jgi:hypothetical protein